LPTIKVNTSKLSSYESELQNILSRVNSICSQFSSVSRNLDWDVKTASNINSRMAAIERELSAQSRGISEMKTFLGNARVKYDAVENKNNGNKLHDEVIESSSGARVNSRDKSTWSISNSSSKTTVNNRKTAAWANKATLATSNPAGTGNSSGSTKTSAKETAIKYLKKIGKSGLDALGKAGTYGKEAALPIAILKNIIDGDGITGKDIGSTIKGMGNSIIGMCDAYAKEAGELPLSTSDIKELAGLTAYKTISTASTKAGWLAKLENAGTSAWSTFKTEISPIVKTTSADGTKVVDSVKTGTKVAGWALSLIANGFSNYDEYNKGEISKGRAVAETVVETAIDIGKGAAIAAGVAAGCAAIGVAAPAVVVGGIGVGVSLVADIVCENLTGKSVTEATSDLIIDTAAKAGKAISGAAKSTKNAVSGWFSKLTSSGGSVQYAGAW
jgi:hypothetical protein